MEHHICSSVNRQPSSVTRKQCRQFNLYYRSSTDIRVNWQIGPTSLLLITRLSSHSPLGFKLDSRSGYCELSFKGIAATWFLISRRQQLRAVAQPNPPAELKNHFTKETYSRATAYSISKLRYNLIKTVFDQTYQYYLIKYHVYSAAWDFAGEWMDSIGLSQSRTVSVKHFEWGLMCRSPTRYSGSSP